MQANSVVSTSRFALVTAAVVGAGGLLLGACSSNASTGGATTTPSTTSGSSGPTGSPSTTSAAQGGPGASGKIAQIEAAISKQSTATFKLVYTTTGSGPATSVTIEQMPPKQAFDVSGTGSGGSGRIIYDGTKTYYCSGSSSGSAPICLSYPAISGTPLSAIVGAYSGETVLAAMKGWQSQLAAGVTGFHESFTTESFAGQSSQCVSWSYHGSSAKYCATSSGILAYAGGQTGSGEMHGFELTSYSANPSPSDFELPPGATVETIPAG